LEKLDNRFGLPNQHKENWTPRQHYTQAASIESVSLPSLLGGARSQLEEIGQIGLKPALSWNHFQ